MVFAKLRGRIAEKGFTGEIMAKRLGISAVTFRNKMNGITDWKLSEIYMLISELGISYEQIYDYFFAPLNFGKLK